MVSPSILAGVAHLRRSEVVFFNGMPLFPDLLVSVPVTQQRGIPPSRQHLRRLNKFIHSENHYMSQKSTKDPNSDVPPSPCVSDGLDGKQIYTPIGALLTVHNCYIRPLKALALSHKMYNSHIVHKLSSTQHSYMCIW